MSAFIMNDSDFYLIAKAVQPSNVGEFADMLKRININSVNFRYNEKTRFYKCKFPDVVSNIAPNINRVKDLINCWTYQSCEMKNDLLFNIVNGFLQDWVMR
jgi:hypothetical protein